MTMNHFVSANREERADINLTPMLDVVFILLIFFVVTATFIRDFGLEVTLPAGLSPTAPELSSIVVVIERDDSFHINGRVLAKGSLVPFIRRLAAENPDAPFSVLVSSNAHVEATVAVLDAGRQAGFRRIPIEKLDDQRPN